ncbi:MAG: adenylosuccinate synthetase [Cyanobacteria bacterium SZAS-4]|nr:adenylosuccinate synthetase [Cyanobacteria bacterium SZAS-4]
MNAGRVIIGANYGDEGKGLFTDYFASQDPENSLVVRFNGGAQAGHTVVTPDGRRHVFSHFGSGSFVGAPTFLSKFFIVNPLIFVREISDLHKLGVKPNITIDGDAMLTTPYDMFINQTTERRRGTKRHGSCGLGINETVTRSLRSPALKLRAREMLNPTLLFQKLIELKTSWFAERLKEFNIDPHSEDSAIFFEKSESILKEFVTDTQTLLEFTSISKCYPNAKHIIFEGAQGLMLDEDRIDQFPHVTRSKTGLTNVLHLAPKFRLDKLNVTYVSRTYLTRHGAGPLDGECDWVFPDSTNVPNQFQGTLRFAPLDLQTLQKSIKCDLLRAQTARNHICADIAMTCLDQVPMPKVGELFLPVNHVCHGPTRAAVRPALSCAER